RASGPVLRKGHLRVAFSLRGWQVAVTLCPARVQYALHRRPGFASGPRHSMQQQVFFRMARLHLEFPEDQFYFTTQLTVRITDINSGKHLANDSMVSMISEARARFLYQFGIEEVSVNDVGIIVTDLATTYRREAFARETLVFEVGLMDLNRYGGDIIFRITKAE